MVGKVVVIVVGGCDGGYVLESVVMVEVVMGLGYCVGWNWCGECVGLNRLELLSVCFGEWID